jgi:hypothetical protein
MMFSNSKKTFQNLGTVPPGNGPYPRKQVETPKIYTDGRIESDTQLFVINKKLKKGIRPQKHDF